MDKLLFNSGRRVLLGFALLSLSLSVSAQMTITGVTLTGPATIPKGGSGEYTITATLTGTPNNAESYTWNLWEEDDSLFNPVDDLLASGLFDPTNLDASGVYTTIVTLTCNQACIISGPKGSDDEMSPASLYVAVSRNFPAVVVESARLPVTCVATPGVPAPGALISFAAIGLGVLRRRKIA